MLNKIIEANIYKFNHYNPLLYSNKYFHANIKCCFFLMKNNKTEIFNIMFYI